MKWKFGLVECAMLVLFVGIAVLALIKGLW
jgi:hypothetical protein